MERAPRMARRHNEKTNEKEVHVAVHLFRFATLT